MADHEDHFSRWRAWLQVTGGSLRRMTADSRNANRRVYTGGKGWPALQAMQGYFETHTILFLHLASSVCVPCNW